MRVKFRNVGRLADSWEADLSGLTEDQLLSELKPRLAGRRLEIDLEHGEVFEGQNRVGVFEVIGDISAPEPVVVPNRLIRFPRR